MESFIETVKQYPCLWNTNDMYFRDVGKKDEAWEHIAKQCRLVNGIEAKNRWRKIRDAHREALRRRRSGIVPIMKPWKYEALMEFVLRQNENSDTFSNFSIFQHTPQDAPSVVIDSPPEIQNTSDIESIPSPSESPVPSPIYIEYENRKQTTPKMPRFETESPLPSPSFTESGKRKQKISDMSHFNNISTIPQDALSNLFSSLCQKTRDLPKYLQLRVQREIFESVTRAEEEAMSLDPLNAYHSLTSARNSSPQQSSSLSDNSDTKPYAFNRSTS